MPAQHEHINYAQGRVVQNASKNFHISIYYIHLCFKHYIYLFDEARRKRNGKKAL